MYCLLFSDCFLFTIHFLTAIHIECFINVGVVSFILKYLLSRQHLKLYFYHNLFSMYFKFESEFNGEKKRSKTGAHF